MKINNNIRIKEFALLHKLKQLKRSLLFGFQTYWRVFSCCLNCFRDIGKITEFLCIDFARILIQNTTSLKSLKA